MNRRPIVQIYVRHAAGCGSKRRPQARDCQCVKWFSYSVGGKQTKVSANTRSWAQAEELRADLQRRLDAGETTQPTKEDPGLLADQITTYVAMKVQEGLQPGTVNVTRARLLRFDGFMAARSKFRAEQVTERDVIEYRASWTLPSTLSIQKRLETLRAFLRFVGRSDLLPALKLPKLTKADYARLEPKPFTEDELRAIINAIPGVFDGADSDADGRYRKGDNRGSRMATLIKLQISTGLAVRDAIQLERSQIKDGWLRIRRQKTSRPVEQKLDPGLYRELCDVANGNTRYVFHDGPSIQLTVRQYTDDLRALMKAAGVYVQGNLSHRFRDTAVDFWLGAGVSLEEISSMLGDTVTVVERHYRSLVSARMAKRLEAVPRRAW